MTYFGNVMGISSMSIVMTGKSFLINPSFLKRSLRLATGVGMMVSFGVLAGCQGGLDDLTPKAQRAVPKILITKMKAKSMRYGSPMLIRIFKQENSLEVWKQKTNGRYALLKDYEICKWSGKFGPKFKEGDRQAPEGFYTVNPYQMNPRSSYHLSFNMGYPNKFDRAHGRTGAHLMVHGACSSAGCYSMTDDRVEEIYSMARDSFKGGQKAFQIQAFPFRLTPENMFAHRDNKHFEFWKMLKVGYDQFEVTKRPPSVEVCGRKYKFNVRPESGRSISANSSCPPLYMRKSTALAYTKIKMQDDIAFDKLLAKAEGRDAKDFSNMSVATALPGIQVVAATYASQVTTLDATSPKINKPSGTIITGSTAKKPGRLPGVSTE
jgi:murein L,D-transpeptidase YafK